MKYWFYRSRTRRDATDQKPEFRIRPRRGYRRPVRLERQEQEPIYL